VRGEAGKGGRRRGSCGGGKEGGGEGVYGGEGGKLEGRYELGFVSFFT